MTNQKSLSISYVNAGCSTGGKYRLDLLVNGTPANDILAARPAERNECVVCG